MPILAVAPHWGAWIEIQLAGQRRRLRLVAPHWGAWIEIKRGGGSHRAYAASHPTGVRGLK